MPRNPRNRGLVRAIQMMLDLEQCRAGRTIDEMAKEFGVTTRTIRRDLNVLQEVGVPLVDDQDDERRRRWRAMNWRQTRRNPEAA